MIKNGFKKFIGVGLFILFGGLFSFNFSSAFIMPINEETTFGDGIITCDANFNCITENANGDTFNGISPSFLTKRNWFVFFNSGLLSEVYGFNTLKTYYVQKRPIEICRTDYNSAINYTQTVTDYLSGCANNINTGNAIIWSQEDLGGKITSYTINTIGSNNGHSAVICANYNEDIKSACFNVRDNLGSNYYFGISDTIFNRDNFVGFGLAESSPWVGGGGNSGGGTLIPVTSDVDYAISYYESTKGFNNNMCYVGTNNLTADFGTAGISFEDGTGSTIFELYNSQFSGFGNNIITNVGKFINVRTLNYGQWFYEGDNIKRLATDNGPDNGVSYIYTGFTFPFANKPVAIFFMASNLLDGYFSSSSMGNDVAFYCYIKLNYSQIKEGNISYTGDVLPLVPPAIQNNVEDYFKYQLNYGNTGYYYTPEWVNNLSGDFTLSENYDLDNVFTNFVDVFNSKLGNITFGYTVGIIPDWILYPLIFLILFRIMKH